MSATTTLIELAKARRSIYKLGRRTIVPDSRIRELVNAAILNIPSSFNTQSTRLVVLLNEEHEKLWDLAVNSLYDLVSDGIISKQVWENQTLPKLQGFKAAYGTVMFYEDLRQVKNAMKKFPLYEHRMLSWSEQSSAMHQWFVWTGLDSLGFGANLQHYDPIINAPVARQWNINPDWKLIGQLVFGSPEGAPKEKLHELIEDRVRIYGARAV